MHRLFCSELAGGDELEEQVGGFGFEGYVAHFLSQQSGPAFGDIELDRLDAQETEFLAELRLASGH